MEYSEGGEGDQIKSKALPALFAGFIETQPTLALRHEIRRKLLEQILYTYKLVDIFGAAVLKVLNIGSTVYHYFFCRVASFKNSL